MLEFTVPVLFGASLIGVIAGLLVRESSLAFLISGYAAVAIFVAAILLLKLSSSLSDPSDWLWFIIFVGAWSPFLFFLTCTVGFATSSLIWRRSHRRE